ncbi:MAG: T9SS type A sorting domain-containing protein [Saprospiraceae bacterium]|nr:T9SS type A sorting domain-containing protein [Saprospiraceae bacterium]
MNKSSIILTILCVLILGLGNSGLHPVTSTGGYTGAPGDSSCGQSGCHTGSTSLDGSITITGLPATIVTNATYTITVTVTNSVGNAVRGGFQMVALTGTNANAGSMSNQSPNTEIRVAGGKNYFGHAPATNFPASDELTYTVTWVAPPTVGTNPNIKFYAAAVIGSGNSGNQLDKVVATNIQVPIIAGSSPLAVTINNVNGTSCSNTNDGSATAVATGGTSPYGYSWTNGVTTPTNNSLSPGVSTVTITDSAGASTSASVTISSPTVLQATAFGSVICQGATNGTASSTASGGTGSYSYLWSNNSTTSNISGLLVGTYTVTVTDDNGCIASKTTSVTVSPPLNISGIVTNVTCNGLLNGGVSTTITGGTPTLNYQWSNNSNQANINNVPAGTYTVTVSDGANCTSSKTFTVSQPAVLNASFSNVVNASCFGTNNGAATITATGGTASYTYTWPNGATGSGASNTQNNLSAGTYTVPVSDFLDCTTTKSVVISQPAAISVVATNLTNVSCAGGNNGSITVSSSGTTGNPSYLWNNGSTNTSINNLIAGTYTVVVTDSGNGCTKSAVFTITAPPLLSATIGNILPVTCHGGSNGTASVSTEGGNLSYIYLWTNGETNAAINNVSAGIYTVTVTDNKGCTASSSVNITQPTPLIINLITSSNASCNTATNGALSVQASNGLAPYTYLWSNGQTGAQNQNLGIGNYTIIVTDSNSCTNSATYTVATNTSFSINLLNSTNVKCFGDSTGSASVLPNPQYTYNWSNGQSGTTASQLPAGIYTVIATDNTGCLSLPLTVSITQAPLIKANLLQVDTILCPADTNGLISLQLSGGTGELTYLWSNSEVSLTNDSLLAGIYQITITDTSNCQKTYAYQIYQADTLEISSIDIMSPLCFGQSNGSIALLMEGGFGSLNYIWSNGAVSNDTINNLAAGSYLVTITDKGGCYLTDSIYVDQPDSLKANVTVIDESEAGKNDGTIFVIPVGGTQPVQIFWDDGSNTFLRDSLSPGLYTYTLQDNNDCLISAWAVVGGGNCLLSATAEVTPATCFNSFDGEISIDVIGNLGDYQIQVYNGNFELDHPLDSVQAGTYTVIITDSLQCLTILQNIVVPSVYTPIIVNQIKKTSPSSFQAKDGSLEAIVNGGEGILKYMWYKVDGTLVGSTPKISNLDAGIYKLVVTDSVSCELVENSILLEVANFVLDEKLKSIQLYPNPVTEYLNIQCNNGNTIEKVEIFDTHYRKVYTQLYSLPTDNINLAVDQMNIFTSGVYLLRISTDGHHINKKLVILK